MATSKGKKGSDDGIVTTVKIESSSKYGSFPNPVGEIDTVDIRRADDKLLAKLGYASEFKREFSVSKS